MPAPEPEGEAMADWMKKDQPLLDITSEELIAELQRENLALAEENERMRTAIERALADEESGKGWGPDVTVCAYLRAALRPESGA